MKPFPESRGVTVTQLNFNQWLSWAWITVELALDASKDDGGTSLNKMRHILPFQLLMSMPAVYCTTFWRLTMFTERYSEEADEANELDNENFEQAGEKRAYEI